VTGAGDWWRLALGDSLWHGNLRGPDIGAAGMCQGVPETGSSDGNFVLSDTQTNTESGQSAIGASPGRKPYRFDRFKFQQDNDLRTKLAIDSQGPIR
jgi:hypothetical protein